MICICKTTIKGRAAPGLVMQAILYRCASVCICVHLCALMVHQGATRRLGTCTWHGKGSHRLIRRGQRCCAAGGRPFPVAAGAVRAGRCGARLGVGACGGAESSFRMARRVQLGVRAAWPGVVARTCGRRSAACCRRIEAAFGATARWNEPPMGDTAALPNKPPGCRAPLPTSLVRQRPFGQPSTEIKVPQRPSLPLWLLAPGRHGSGLPNCYV